MKEANNELRKEFNELKKLVVSLKSKLNQLGSAKRKISQESKDLRNKILSNTGRIKTLKAERDGLTKKVKELKEEREKLNKEVKDKFTVKKDIDIRRRELFQKLNLKQDPEQLREQIAALELKIETEPMPFSKEKQITKTIKDMKKKYWEVEKLGGVWKEISEASQEIGQTKTKAEDTHQEIQKLAQESQKKHEELNILFNELKPLREKIQPFAEEMLKLTVEYENVKKELEENLAKFNELSQHFKDEEEKSAKAIFQEKTAEVKEKIKKGKKLSTEDILAYQATKE